MFSNKNNFQPFESKVWLSSPTMYPDSMKYVMEAYETNWMSTVGANINEVERLACEKVGCKYAVALSAGTAALHMAVKLAGVKPGDKVFCSDMTFDATVNPVVYEGGVPVFIDTEYDTWNMDPVALEKAFEIYPEVKVVVVAHLYGTPGKIAQIKAICEKNGATIIEDAAESLGATYKGVQTGTFGTYNAISFNGNKIITGSSGGMLLTDSEDAANKVRKWSTQARENAPWYQHEELGYNYRMSNVIAGVVRNQFPHLEEHIAQKKAIYERYREGFKGLPVKMNPYDANNSEPILDKVSDNRIRIYKNENNLGAAASRNRALQEARGQWIAFLDSDDLWLPGKLEKQIAFMKKNGYSFSYTNYEEIDVNGNKTGVRITGPKKITKRGMLNYCWPGCLTVMYDADRVGLIQIENIKKNNDYAMWLKISKKVDCFLLDEYLGLYRKGRRGSVSTHSIITMIKWHYKLFRNVEKKGIVSSTLHTIRNLLFGFYKKNRYVKRERR